jgi:hypothetical protein
LCDAQGQSGTLDARSLHRKAHGSLESRMKTHVERVAAFKARQRAKGLCGACPRPWTGPQANCDVCRAKKSAREKAKRAAVHVLREAAGLPPHRHGWCGLQSRPQDIHRHSPDRQQELVITASKAASRKRQVQTTAEVLLDVRRRLLDVRSTFTPEQITDLLPIFLRLHLLGVERERQRLHQGRYRSERRAKATTTEAA